MKKKILVIDDETLLMRTFSLLLEKNGYDVIIAKNSEDAEALADGEQFDLIICDIRMPGQDGIQTSVNIRNPKSVNANTPLIFVTGYADAMAESKARSLNPVAYFSKPFDNAEILDAIKKI